MYPFGGGSDAVAASSGAARVLVHPARTLVRGKARRRCERGRRERRRRRRASRRHRRARRDRSRVGGAARFRGRRVRNSRRGVGVFSVVSVGAQRGGHRRARGLGQRGDPARRRRRVLVSGGADRAVKLWRARRGGLRRSRRGPRRRRRAWRSSRRSSGTRITSRVSPHPRRRQAGARFSAPAWARTRCSCGTPLGAPRRTEATEKRTRPSRASPGRRTRRTRWRRTRRAPSW